MPRINEWSNWETFIAWELMNEDADTKAKIEELNRWWNIKVKRKAFSREKAIKIVEIKLLPVLKKYNVKIDKKKVNKNEIVQKILHLNIL